MCGNRHCGGNCNSCGSYRRDGGGLTEVILAFALLAIIVTVAMGQDKPEKKACNQEYTSETINSSSE